MLVWEKADALCLFRGVNFMAEHGPELHFFWVDGDGVACMSTDGTAKDAAVVELIGDMGWHRCGNDRTGGRPRTVWKYEVTGKVRG